MSRRLPRVLVSGGAAALALVLSVPSVALADNGNGSGHGKSGDKGHGSKPAKSAAGKTDPAGNNGTIKIDYPAPADSGHANRPHPGCAFQLRMFDFDQDQYGSITFVGQAPTKLGTLLTQSHVLLSDDPAGGGQDVDAVYSYTAQQLGLIGQPQAKQGWHIKVMVDAENAPGGAKQKVFWLSCPAPATSPSSASAAGTASGSAATGSAATGSTATGSTATGSTAAGPAVGAGTLTGTATGAATGARQQQAAGFTGGGAHAVVTAPKRTVSARGFGAALPFTGLALGTMIALALGALAAGALAIRAGRRRTAGDL